MPLYSNVWLSVLGTDKLNKVMRMDRLYWSGHEDRKEIDWVKHVKYFELEGRVPVL